VELSVFERLMLLNILPAEGDLPTLRVVRKMREDLSFTEAEHAALRLDNKEGQITWRTALPQEEAEAMPSDKAAELNAYIAALNKGVEIALGPKAREIAREALEKMNKEKKLREEHLSLCDKFEVGAE